MTNKNKNKNRIHLGWPKGKKRGKVSNATRDKMRQSALKHQAKLRKLREDNKVSNELMMTNIMNRINGTIADDDRKKINDIKNSNENINSNICPFCKNMMFTITDSDGYYYCKKCGIVINPQIRWKVLLPRGK